MNKLWNLQNYSAEALHRTVRRDGLRVRIHPQVHPFLRREVHTFVRWLRANYPFPIRVNVYIPNTKKIRANDGDLCYGRCFVPDDPDDSITMTSPGATTTTATFGRCKITHGEPSSCWRTSWGTTTST